MIQLDGPNFKDEFGRTLLLRGVNLGGSSKVPTQPNGATWNKEGFYDHRNVSFVGRPFPLDEADEHYRRLRAWGLTFLRFLVTWEAIEHAGPGLYDQEYLDYLYAVIKKAADYGIQVFIDPHEDVWSRFSGGDGAPGWTLEAAGFDMPHLHASGAAILHQEHGDPFPRMIWPTNNNKLAAATMWTLFFAGNDFSPKLQVDGVPIQEYLQSHYINAIRQVALRLKDLPNVVGYDSLNEPSQGFIGAADVRGHARGAEVFIGAAPTIFQSMCLGAGFSQVVDVYELKLTGFKKTGTSLVNPQRVCAWQPGRDIWKKHGVWSEGPDGQPVLQKADYFRQVGGREVVFYTDYFKPFVNRFAQAIRSVSPEAILFVEGVPDVGQPSWGPDDAQNIVNAAHWYDGLTLLRKTFSRWIGADSQTRRLVFGLRRIRACFQEQIARIRRHSEQAMGQAPTLIGETGIPFDMDDKKAYRTGDFSMQIEALDAIMAALEKNFVSFTLWNYTADNTNARGDQWNDEDLSLFSRDQISGSGSIHDGGRALPAAVRPYAAKVAGQPLSTSFDRRKAAFEFRFRHDEAVTAPTEFFIPNYHYPQGCRAEVSDGEFELDLPRQALIYRHTSGQEIHTVRIKPE